MSEDTRTSLFRYLCLKCPFRISHKLRVFLRDIYSTGSGDTKTLKISAELANGPKEVHA